MTEIFYIATIIVGVTAQSVAKKPYTEKNGDKGAFFFTAAVSLFALLFFAVFSGGLAFNAKILPYSAAFAVSYCLATVFTVLAISNGSLSLTSLFISYSLMIPTFYGLIFLRESVSVGFIPGIVLLFFSLIFINGKQSGGVLSVKWVIYTAVALISNGMCSVVQNLQQRSFNGEYKNELMIAALALVFVVMLTAAVLFERRGMKQYFKSGIVPGAVCGVMNGVVNLFVMLVTEKMSVSLVFPLISAGGIIATYAVSRLFYRERLTKLQLTGFILGLGSVVLLNI